MELDRLVLRRFNGIEEYVISSATARPGRYGDAMRLWLEVEARLPPLRSLSDTSGVAAQPQAEICLPINFTSPATLVGQRLEVPAHWEDDHAEYWSRLYYCEHQDLEQNTIAIIAADADRILATWSAETTDVNYYDGSKPKMKVEIHAWFDLVTK